MVNVSHSIFTSHKMSVKKVWPLEKAITSRASKTFKKNYLCHLYEWYDCWIAVVWLFCQTFKYFDEPLLPPTGQFSLAERNYPHVIQIVNKDFALRSFLQHEVNLQRILPESFKDHVQIWLKIGEVYRSNRIMNLVPIHIHPWCSEQTQVILVRLLILFDKREFTEGFLSKGSGNTESVHPIGTFLSRPAKTVMLVINFNIHLLFWRSGVFVPKGYFFRIFPGW